MFLKFVSGGNLIVTMACEDLGILTKKMVRELEKERSRVTNTPVRKVIKYYQDTHDTYIIEIA